MTDPQQLHPDVQRLLRLVPPPTVPAHVADDEMWRSAEAIAGVEYPIEMKQLHRAYGSGWFDDFVWVLNPAPHHDAYTLFDFDLNEFAPQDVARVVPGVRAKEILPIAWTRAGEEFYYVARGPCPLADMRSGCARSRSGTSRTNAARVARRPHDRRD